MVLVMMDVTQAFPSFAKGRMANTLWRLGMNENVIRWTHNFMEERRVKLS